MAFSAEPRPPASYVPGQYFIHRDCGTFEIFRQTSTFTVCVCACVCVCVYACVRACVRPCVCGGGMFAAYIYCTITLTLLNHNIKYFIVVEFSIWYAIVCMCGTHLTGIVSNYNNRGVICALAAITSVHHSDSARSCNTQMYALSILCNEIHTQPISGSHLQMSSGPCCDRSTRPCCQKDA